MIFFKGIFVFFSDPAFNIKSGLIWVSKNCDRNFWQGTSELNTSRMRERRSIGVLQLSAFGNTKTTVVDDAAPEIRIASTAFQHGNIPTKLENARERHLSWGIFTLVSRESISDQHFCRVLSCCYASY